LQRYLVRQFVWVCRWTRGRGADTVPAMRTDEPRPVRHRKARALLTIGGLLGALVPLGGTSSAAASGPGDGVFFVHCNLASTTAYRVDPILSRTGPSAHNHVFFGNTNIPAVAASGNFAGLTDANLEPPMPGQTKCSELSDGTGEWFPELFYDGAQRLYEGGVQANVAIYTRTYYKSDGQNVANPPGTNIPDRLQMINGFPTRTSPPAANDLSGHVYWDCSANGAASVAVTPHSPWPYSCSAWRKWVLSLNLGLTTPPDDGIVAIVDFPNCLIPGSDHNLDRGPLYVPPGVPGTNDLEFGTGTMNGCPAGTVPIPFISERLHTLIDDPTTGAVDDPLVASTSSWSGLPSCNSPNLSFKTPSGTTETAPCTDTPPQASDLRMGFASDRAPTGGNACKLPVASACGWFTVHADYMQMWYQVDPSRLDTAANGTDLPDADPVVNGHFAPALEDAEEDCIWGAEAHDCGFIPGNTLSGV